MLFDSFRRNYGMSLSIQDLDLSNNKLSRIGSEWLGGWLNMIREKTHLQHLYLSSTHLDFSSIGRFMVHLKRIVTLDLSHNRLDEASCQLLTLVIESTQNLRNLNLSGCGITSEYAGKILQTILSNPFVADVKVSPTPLSFFFSLSLVLSLELSLSLLQMMNE